MWLHGNHGAALEGFPEDKKGEECEKCRLNQDFFPATVHWMARCISSRAFFRDNFSLMWA